MFDNNFQFDESWLDWAHAFLVQLVDALEQRQYSWLAAACAAAAALYVLKGGIAWMRGSVFGRTELTEEDMLPVKRASKWDQQDLHNQFYDQSIESFEDSIGDLQQQVDKLESQYQDLFDFAHGIGQEIPDQI